MKKIIFTLLAAVLAFPAIAAVGEPVKIADLRLAKVGDQVRISFEARADRKAVRSDYTLYSVPVLTDGTNRVELVPVTVRGNRARISADRKAMSRGIRRGESKTPYTISNGGVAVYEASVPYQPWMEGSNLILEQRLEGCCSTNRTPGLTLAQNNQFVIPEPVVVLPPPPKVEVPKEPVKSTGDRLAEKYAFLAPSENFENPNADFFEKFSRGSREGSLTIYFRQSKADIDRGYMVNDKALADLMEAIRSIENSSDSRIVHVVIAGYASPEGSKEINDRLAMQRAQALKELIVRNSRLAANDITLHSGGVDWWQLRRMVAASDMKEKNRILDIIDNTPVWDARRQVGRNGELMRLNGGNPYRYMFEHFFPELRNATYIKIYYKNQ